MSDVLVSPGRRTLMLATLSCATTPALGLAAGKDAFIPNVMPDATAGRVVLSGRVVSADGTPLPGVPLKLGHNTSRVLTDTEGHFLWTGELPEQGLFQCSLGDTAGKPCRMSADLWLARQPGEPYQLHASQDQQNVWRVSLDLPQAA